MENLSISLAIGPWQLLLILGLLLLPALALISVLKNDFKNNDKIIWALVVLFLPFLGTLLYLIIGRPKRIRKQGI